SAHQRKQADNVILAALAAAPGGNPWLGFAVTTQIVEEYHNFRSFTYPMPGLMDSSYELAFLRGPARLEEVASAIALGMGSAGTGTNRINVQAGYLAGAYVRGRSAVAASIEQESKRRVGVDATLVLSGLNPWVEAGV